MVLGSSSGDDDEVMDDDLQACPFVGSLLGVWLLFCVEGVWMVPCIIGFNDGEGLFCKKNRLDVRCGRLNVC